MTQSQQIQTGVSFETRRVVTSDHTSIWIVPVPGLLIQNHFDGAVEISWVDVGHANIAIAIQQIDAVSAAGMPCVGRLVVLVDSTGPGDGMASYKTWHAVSVTCCVDSCNFQTTVLVLLEKSPWHIHRHPSNDQRAIARNPQARRGLDSRQDQTGKETEVESVLPVHGYSHLPAARNETATRAGP